MAAIATYPKYSDFQHDTSSDLVSKRYEIFEAIFPNNMDGGIRISALLIMSSAGSYTLLLGDALAFANLKSCDTLREICPVSCESSQVTCSADLQLAIRTHGMAITESPRLVAVEIGPHTSRPGADPEAELIRVISRQAAEVYIGGYRIRRIENTWQPPGRQPNWRGLAFEQSDRMIRTWLHEANPNALQSARDEAQGLIDNALRDQNQKQAEIERQRRAGRYSGAIQITLDRGLAEIGQTLQERQNRLNYLTVQTVNSAARTTLQCAITVQIDGPDKIQLLERFVRQKIVTFIDRALDELSWEDLQIGTAAIEGFIRQKFNALEQRIPRLAERSAQSEEKWNFSGEFRPVTTIQGGTLRNWLHFRDGVMPEKQRWIRQTFPEFCREKIGHPIPTEAERVPLEREWKEGLSEKLKWVTAQLSAADDALKSMEDRAFVDTDITISDAHRQQMVQVLRRGNQMTYGLGEELDKRYQERDLLHNLAGQRQWVHLVKRITTSGAVYFGVAAPPANPNDRPDPNSDLNEVHVPIVNIPNSFRQIVQNQGQPQGRSSRRNWKWIIGGAGLFAVGAWLINRYLGRHTV